MSSPSKLGDLGFEILAVLPLNTATGRHYVKNSGTDTGTVVTTSRTLDFKKALHETGLTTGAKPLDATVHRRLSAIPTFKCLTLSIPIKANFHDSGHQIYVKVDHKTRDASAGAGSTWRTLKTETVRWKMGTDTDAVLHGGFASSVNAQAMGRYYKANLTFMFRLASSTGAKDTTTSLGGFTCYNPSVILSGGPMPQVSVPAR